MKMKKNSILGLLVLSIFAASCAFAYHPTVLTDSSTGMTVTLYPSGDHYDGAGFFYQNDRFEYGVDIPDFFFEVVLLPENEDGLILTTRCENARFRASGGFVMFEDELRTSLEAAKKHLENDLGGTVTSEKTGDDWWELSWRNGSENGIRRYITNGILWSDCEFTWSDQLNLGFQYDGLPDAAYKLFERSLQTLNLGVG